jgi:hypothetical protein
VSEKWAEELEEEANELGGVWTLGNVGCRDVCCGWSKAARDEGAEKNKFSVRDFSKMAPKKICLWNKFSVLDEEIGDLRADKSTIGHVGVVEEHNLRIDAVEESRGENCRKKKYKVVKKGKITVDSGAEESVMPGEMLPEEEMKMAKKKRFIAANGNEMAHYGEKDVKFRCEGGDAVSSITFQASDVTKPLVAVKRIAEKGNIVQFGPEEKDCFIQNIKTKKKIPMKKEGGTYILEVEYLVEKDADEDYEDKGKTSTFTRPEKVKA